jgi:hypothetical protein
MRTKQTLLEKMKKIYIYYKDRCIRSWIKYFRIGLIID